MNKYIIVSCLIAITFGVTINLSNTCSCSDYNQQTECTARPHCQWTSSSTCVDFPCSTYNAATNCTSATPQSAVCYWTGSACTKFTSCTDLSGTNTTACSTQNPACTWTQGTKCVLPASCPSFTAATCPTTCYNATTSCTDFASCDQRKSAENCALTSSCFWNTNSTSCVAAVCSNLKNDTTCTSVSTSTTLTPCIQGTSGCVDADPSTYTTTLCATNTNGLYHWSKANVTDGSCVACYAVIVQIMFAFILLLA